MKQFLATENFLKIMKNAFYKKPKVNFELYDRIGGKQIIAIHRLSNISKSKDNQATEFLQLRIH